MAFLIFFLSFVVHAFTLNNNFGASFSSSKVSVRIANTTLCDEIGITVYDLEEMLGPAVDNFWNKVPTSSLRLNAKGFTDNIANINLGRLCAPTDDDCITSATNASEPVIPPVDGIVIACNGNAANFESTNVLAVTIPNKFSGRSIKGAVILLNNRVGTQLRNLSQADRIGVLAHEIGHAIGLGHTDDKAALMYYRVVDQRRALGEDDIRGVSYLYPVKLDGCGLFGGFIDTDRIDPNLWQLLVGFLAVMLVMKLLQKLKRLLPRPLFQ